MSEYYGAPNDFRGYLMHYGILGMKWGVRRYQNPDGSLTPEGYKHYGYKKSQKSLQLKKASNRINDILTGDTLFISGSSKTQDKKSGYYRRTVPKEVLQKIDESIAKNDKIIVGDAPGIDRQVQLYLKRRGYNNVEVYGPGTKVRYSANKHWTTKPINSRYKEGSPEWLREKDIAMTKASTKGLAVILDEGATATRRNVARLVQQNKPVEVFQLNQQSVDQFVDQAYIDEMIRKLPPL